MDSMYCDFKLILYTIRGRNQILVREGRHILRREDGSSDQSYSHIWENAGLRKGSKPDCRTSHRQMQGTLCLKWTVMFVRCVFCMYTKRRGRHKLYGKE